MGNLLGCCVVLSQRKQCLTVLQDPAGWIFGVKKAVRLALEHCDRERIGGIAVSGQQHGLVALDAEHQVPLFACWPTLAEQQHLQATPSSQGLH